MTFKMIKPFVLEFITFIFVVSTICIALITGNFIEIIFHVHLLTVVVVILVFASLLSLFSRIVSTGVKALTDFVLQNTKEDVYVFVKEQPYKASAFTEKFGYFHERSVGMYYLIHLKKGNEMYTLISSSYVDLIEGKTYRVKSGSSSNIFLSSNPIEH